MASNLTVDLELLTGDIAGVRAPARQPEESDIAQNLRQRNEDIFSGIVEALRRQLSTVTDPDQRAALENDIAQLVAMSRGGVTPTLLDQAQRTLTAQTSGVSVAAEGNTYSAASIAASTAAQMDSLRAGRYADIYFSRYDREGLYTEQSQRVLSQLVNNDPEVQIAGQRFGRFAQRDRREAIENSQRNQEWLVQEIANANDPAVRRLLEQAERLGAFENDNHIQALREALASGNPQGLTQTVEALINERAASLASNNMLKPGGSVFRMLLRHPEFTTPDGLQLDYVRLARFAAENPEEMAAAHDRVQRGVGSARDQALAALAGATAIASTTYSLNQSSFYALRGILRDNEHSAFITDTSQSAERRAELLTDAMVQRMVDRDPTRTIDRNQIARDAREFIDLFDTNPAALAAVRNSQRGGGRGQAFNAFFNDFSDDLGAIRVDNGLESLGLSATQIQRIKQVANEYPELQSVLDNSFLGNNSVLSRDQQRTLFTNVANNGGPENQNTLSTLRYYGLMNSYEGAQIVSNVFMGSIDAATAARQAETLRTESIARMEAYAGLVPQSLTPNQRDVLRQAGLMSAEGAVDVNQLLERARTNYDALGSLTDVELRAITSRPDSALTPEEMQTRVIAQAAVRFRSVDVIQNFAAEISQASRLLGTAEETPALRERIERYNRMTNSDGLYTVDEQRTALSEFLGERLQYLRANESLRGRMVDYVMELNRSSNIFRSAEFASNEFNAGSFTYTPVAADPSAQPQTPSTDPIEHHAHTREELRELRKEGINPGDRADATFQTQMEDRIQDVLNGMSAQQAVATFGTLLGQYNVGHADNITHHEIENALAAIGKTDVRHVGNGDTRLTAQELVDVLREANFNAPQTAVGVDAHDHAVPAAPAGARVPQPALGNHP